MSTPDESKNHIKESFSFLVSSFNFRISREEVLGDSVCIEYKSDHMYVRLLIMPPDFEPRFVFGRVLKNGLIDQEIFDWVDIGALDCCREWKWQYHKDQPFSGRLTELARILHDCGEDILNNKNEPFEEIKEKRDEQKNQHVKEEMQKSIRFHADNAWENKEYQKVYDLYSKLSGSLSEIEKKRLSYSERKIMNKPSCKASY